MSKETAFDFPCDFPIKMMGRNTPEFRMIAVTIIEAHTGTVDDEQIQSALSRNGRFVSITITISAQSQQQLDDIYEDVSAHNDVLMAL